MRKRRHLRKGFEEFLTVITIIQFIFIAMIDDMTMEFIPIYLGTVCLIAFNIYILKTYGKGVYYE